MKVTRRFRYGLRAVAAIATSPAPLSAARIAKEQDLSPKYLEAILGALRQAGLLEARRGPRGGYRLAREPASIRLFDIMAALGDGQGLVDCVRCPESCARAPCCATRPAWALAGERIRAVWEGITVADVVGGI